MLDQYRHLLQYEIENGLSFIGIRDDLLSVGIIPEVIIELEDIITSDSPLEQDQIHDHETKESKIESLLIQQALNYQLDEVRLDEILERTKKYLSENRNNYTMISGLISELTISIEQIKSKSTIELSQQTIRDLNSILGKGLGKLVDEEKIEVFHFSYKKDGQDRKFRVVNILGVMKDHSDLLDIRISTPEGEDDHDIRAVDNLRRTMQHALESGNQVRGIKSLDGIGQVQYEGTTYTIWWQDVSFQNANAARCLVISEEKDGERICYLVGLVNHGKYMKMSKDLKKLIA